MYYSLTIVNNVIFISRSIIIGTIFVSKHDRRSITAHRNKLIDKGSPVDAQPIHCSLHTLEDALCVRLFQMSTMVENYLYQSVE